MSENFKITPDIELALKRMNAPGGVVFLTGKAGTGKSTLLKYFIKKTKLKTVVTATTGVAALNAGGQTLHSFFKITPPFEMIKIEEAKSEKMRKIYKALECLIIDEVSMLNPRMLDAVDALLKVNRHNRQPFGGVKVILIGDLLQLPPVISDLEQRYLDEEGYETPYFFSAKSLKGQRFEVVVLKEIFRQKDIDFINVLSNVRRGACSIDDFDLLNRQVDPYFEPVTDDLYLTLATTNAIANGVNARRLEDLRGKIHTFEAVVEGIFPANMYPTDTTMTLKVGAQIMFIRNDVKGRWVNGTIGKIVEFYPKIEPREGEEEDEQEQPILKVDILHEGQERTVYVENYCWENYNVEFNVAQNSFMPKSIGKFIQLPIRLAWAVTIHKSQGQTFDRVIIDLGRGTFSPGQTYVALSRCRTLEGIVLRRAIQPIDVKTDERVIHFIRNYSKQV